MKKYLKLTAFLIVSALNVSVFALPFNSKLTEEELTQLNAGEVLIKNIDRPVNICLEYEANPYGKQLIDEINNLKPKYLAEVIQIKPYKGNEALPEKLESLLMNVPDYAGIPYWSVRHQQYFDLYSSATITSLVKEDNKTSIVADLWMDPFDTVIEDITIYESEDGILYTSYNQKNMLLNGKINCVNKRNMNMSILLFRDGENWILYGIGGVNAPKIPFFDERIQVSFINRIKTFCNFVFTKLAE